jgi:putative transposase
MGRFKKQSHTNWFCEYHIVWCPKYRYRVLQGKTKEEVELCVREQTRQMECEVVELSVQVDRVHLLPFHPPTNKTDRPDQIPRSGICTLVLSKYTQCTE